MIVVEIGLDPAVAGVAPITRAGVSADVVNCSQLERSNRGDELFFRNLQTMADHRPARKNRAATTLGTSRTPFHPVIRI